MKTLKITLFLFFIFFFCNSIKSQEQSDSAWVKLITKDRNAIIYLDGNLYKSGTLLKVISGEHIITAEALGSKKYRKTIQTVPNQVKLVRIELKNTDEYESYSKSLKSYKFKKNALRYGPAIFYSIYATITYLGINENNENADRYANEAAKFDNQYSTSFWISDLESNRRNYELNKSKHNDEVNAIDKKVNGLIIGAGVTALLTATGFYFASKLEEPIFKNESSFIQINPVYLGELKGININFYF